MSERQGTLLVKDLQPKTIYRDVLSGRLVLVMGVNASGADCKWWNPVKGELTTMLVCDHQLESAEYPSKLYPRQDEMMHLLSELRDALKRTIGRQNQN